MKNILLTLSFDGTRYHGFQVQKNAVSICSVLQDAMQQLFGARPDVKGCSRTDAGVHARMYCLNFWQDTTVEIERLPAALNYYLPMDIRVNRAQLVPEGFHARYSALGKEYEYRILNATIDDPFYHGYYHKITKPLDEVAMQRAGSALVGKHDFSAFMASGGSVRDTVRTITSLQVVRKDEYIKIRVCGDGFLYNMVRIIAGSLVYLPGEMEEILASKNRNKAGPTLPAKGLFLQRVLYNQKDLTG